MKQIPKAVRDLQGDLWVPVELANLLERVLRDARDRAGPQERRHLAAVEQLMGFEGDRPLPPVREQLGLPDPHLEQVALNLLKG